MLFRSGVELFEEGGGKEEESWRGEGRGGGEVVGCVDGGEVGSELPMVGAVEGEREVGIGGGPANEPARIVRRTVGQRENSNSPVAGHLHDRRALTNKELIALTLRLGTRRQEKRDVRWEVAKAQTPQVRWKEVEVDGWKLAGELGQQSTRNAVEAYFSLMPSSSRIRFRPCLLTGGKARSSLSATPSTRKNARA